MGAITLFTHVKVKRTPGISLQRDSMKKDDLQHTLLENSSHFEERPLDHSGMPRLSKGDSDMNKCSAQVIGRFSLSFSICLYSVMHGIMHKLATCGLRQLTTLKLYTLSCAQVKSGDLYDRLTNM